MNDHRIIQNWIADFQQKHKRKPSHLEITEKMLRTFQWTTGIDARPYCFEASFRSRVSNLRQRGLPVESVPMSVKSKDGRRATVRAHRIAGGDV